MKHLGFHTLRDRKTDVLSDKLSQQLKSELNPALSDEELFSFADFNADRAERGGYSGYSYWGSTLRAFFQNKVAVFFLIVMLSVLTFTLIQPYLPGQKDPLLIHNDQWGLPLNNVAPCGEFWFGTNAIGQDLWARIWAGTRTSLFIGFTVAMVEAVVGILVGVLWGYVRKLDFFFTELYNVLDNIPQTLLLILISYSISPELRGPTTVAVVIGFTSWPWTARSVRSQVISLRNRDHVNLSKLSGHSLLRIVVTDILPYIASYVVMAFILQVSSGILSEAQLSLLSLGPKTTVTPTLGLMMNWAMSYSAHINGTWWAYLPVILTITLISFSLNLMNTGLDQVFNPTLRD